MASQPASFKNPNKYAERSFSTDDTEEEHLESNGPLKKRFKEDFKNPAQYIERETSTDQTTDSESEEKMVTNKSPANMPTMNTLKGQYGSVAKKMMEKMGWTGTGLGKNAQGRVNIVEASKQRGRRGLGHIIPGIEPSDDVDWDSSKEELSVVEELTWMPNCPEPPLDITLLRSWMKLGKKIEFINNEIEFCDPEILEEVVSHKSVFDNLEPEEMRKARTKSNPFEIIRGGIFLNRAAMKMANMDFAFDFMFTDPKTINGDSAVSEDELLYFADVCAGPGGFSEYVLWRKRWDCKGFGFTLKGDHDFKIEDFFAGPSETFEPYYGENDDGDVYSSRNLRSLQKLVRSSTDGKGVHFMMADGGFSVEGRENEQEILSKRLYLCQFLCALLIVRTGGHFVCKLFDLFTVFSVGLVYLMWMAFEQVCIFKPNTSRPANSERYIVCKWLKEDIKDICDYMFEVNETLDKYFDISSADIDVSEVVPLQILKDNEEFYTYIVNSNNKLGAKQIIHLEKIKVFAQNVNLHDETQSEVRKECLKKWKVPDQARAAPPKADPDAKYKLIMQGEKLSYINGTFLSLTADTLKNLSSIFDFHCVVCGESKLPPSLFIGLGKSNIYQYNQLGKWVKLEEVQFQLPADTLLYGELVSELKGESRGQRKINCLHIIDAIHLGGVDVRKLHYKIRMQKARKLAKAVSKSSKSGYSPLRVKEVWGLEHVDDILKRLSMKYIKNSPVPKLCYALDEERHIIPNGLLIFKTTAEPWITAYSKTAKKEVLFQHKEE